MDGNAETVATVRPGKPAAVRFTDDRNIKESCTREIPFTKRSADRSSRSAAFRCAYALGYQLLYGLPSSETRFEPLCTSTIPSAVCVGERGASSFSTCQVSFDPVKGSVGILPR